MRVRCSVIQNSSFKIHNYLRASRLPVEKNNVYSASARVRDRSLIPLWRHTVDLIREVTQEYLKTDIPDFRPGDNLKVHVRLKEGEKERIQIFEGLVIARKHGGLSATFTVRKISSGIGVERTFPLHSPSVAKVEVTRRGRVRRAKLYYIRGLRGKAARIRERSQIR